jgi:4-hydroxybenzoate polyprenyltransferase
VPSEGASGARMAMLAAIVVSMRPRQWVKNLFVLAGLVFSQRLLTESTWVALEAFAIFCAVSGAIYLLNDVADRERDQLDPRKRERPIAAGRLPVGVAIGTATALIVVGLGLSAWLSRPFLVTVVVYVVLFVAYSAWLKHIVIVDVLAVASGFVLRALAGAVVIAVEMSGWLLICTILLALFLALGKRRFEYLTLDRDATRHRPILAEYTPELLDQMIAVVTASTVTAYALYTMSPETVAKFHTRLLPATLPFVLYGIFRYLYLLYRRQLGGNPSELLLSDRALTINAIGWICAVLLIIYGTRLE